MHNALHRTSAARPLAAMVPWHGAALMGLVLLLIISPVGLRVFLSSAGLLGLAGLRLAASREGWARRGAAWS
jgi:hypothetical protein